MAKGQGWQVWRRGRIQGAFAASWRFTLALTGIMGACWYLDRAQAIIPLLLGVIASALAETDDSWRGRLGGQLATLLCFALMIMAVQVSLAEPLHLMLVLVAAAFFLTLLGALGERYRAMASATLIMALYAALATEPGASRSVAGGQEILLLCGSAWYGLISVLWAAAFPMLPVEQNLARLYESLGRYLELKSKLFEPVRDVDLEQLRLELALYNGRVVDALNAAKESLAIRMNPAQIPDWLRAALQQYFVAQDVHERASSSHEHYDLLVRAFFHSDVLYRCQRVLALLGKDCLALAEAIRKQEPWVISDSTRRAPIDLEAAIRHVEAISPPASGEVARRTQRSLRALAGNLAAMEQEIAGVLQEGQLRLPADTTLQDLQPRTLQDFRDRLLGQLTLRSPLMRHAIRLSVALAAGYGLMLLTDDTHGFWILLTIVFVCQPQYAATVTRLMERIGGTLLGLLVGWALLRLFPDELAQSAFTVLAGVLFFVLRANHYTLATAGITTLVLLSFNQVGDGFGLIVPRLLDTLAGSLISGIAVWLVLPSWYSLRLHHLAAATVRAQSRYLGAIMAQYGAGKHDNLAYRIARRAAHNADAALSGALTAAFKEPGYVKRNAASGTRFLVLSHTLLNYLSALGAHRNARLERADDMYAAAGCLQEALEKLAEALEAGTPLPGEALPAEIGTLEVLSEHARDESEFHRVLCAQLAFALRLLPMLRSQSGELAPR